MTARTLLRVGLLRLAAMQARAGAWALPAPHAFYDDMVSCAPGMRCCAASTAAG